jgi:hypothetical protein
MTATDRITAAALRAALLLGVALAAPGVAAAQSAPLALNASAAEEGGKRASALERGRYAVVIDLDENVLYFRKGEVTLWSAPVGTGTALRMKGKNGEWDFATPNGVFQVKYKEQEPAWIAPDWYFVENGLPVPPPNDKKRVFPGGLGAAAVFISQDLAIHGTDKPELLGQRVSHGCIRLANKDALRLFHNVQVGTEVVIVGGEDIERKVITPEEMLAKKNFDPKPKKAPRDALLDDWKAADTGDLLVTLENELWLDPEVSRWPEVAALLLERGLEKHDDKALKGLMAMASDLPTVRLEREYATFLADSYARGPLRTLTALSRLGWSQRERVADAIVEATMELYHGAWDESAAPWPTARVPRNAVEPEGWKGWDVLADAERGFRKDGGRKRI